MLAVASCDWTSRCSSTNQAVNDELDCLDTLYMYVLMYACTRGTTSLDRSQAAVRGCTVLRQASILAADARYPPKVLLLAVGPNGMVWHVLELEPHTKHAANDELDSLTAQAERPSSMKSCSSLKMHC